MYYDESIENQIAMEERPQHTIPGGQINETPGNLFDYEKDYALVHCISADFFFNAGINKFFQARYSTRDELRQAFPQGYWIGRGYCLPTNNNHVFNLVTKYQYWDKTTMQTLEQALRHMKEICEARGVTRLAMPRLGTGFDKLNWLETKQMIMDIFAGTDFDIRIVYLDEYLQGTILDPDIEKINFGKDRKHIDGNVEKKYY